MRFIYDIPPIMRNYPPTFALINIRPQALPTTGVHLNTQPQAGDFIAL